MTDGIFKGPRKLDRRTEQRDTPQLKDTAKVIEKLAELGCTEKEIAESLNVTARCFSNWKNNYPGIQEALNCGWANLKRKLREAQLEVAIPRKDEGYKGNAQMLMFLGKNVLGQSDKLTLSGDEKEPIAIKLGWSDLPKKEDEDKPNDEIEYPDENIESNNNLATIIRNELENTD